MNRLCFGTFAKILQNALQKPNSNQAVAELLLGLLADMASVWQLSSDYSIKPKKVSELFNFKDDVHGDIVSLASTPKVINAMPGNIQSKVVPYLIVNQIEDMIENLRKLITADDSIAPNKQSDLLAFANKDNLPKYLSEVYLYAINRPNKPSKSMSGKDDMEIATELSIDIALVNKIYAKYSRPEDLAVPTEPTDEELEYIAQLLAAYAEAEGIAELSCGVLTSYPKYSIDLRQRRKEYYAAETIRRGTREVFKENESGQFELLKEETYEGVFDALSQSCKHGYERLLRVMTQVSAIQINKCPLSKLPEWIGNKEKKGVCHILVNEGTIKWVVRDE